MSADDDNSDYIIDVRGLQTRFGSTVIHDGVDLAVRRGEILALVGGSGSGKTTLMHQIIMLRRPSAGSIRFFDRQVVGISDREAQELRKRFGVLFQYGALFSSLSVLENIAVPLREHTGLSEGLIEEIATVNMIQSGLPLDTAGKYPNELSGGMIKRAALARAMVLDPEVLFLDEPTSGLDPQSAAGFDALVLSLKELLGLTILMVTHDMDSLWQVADRVAVLGRKQVIAVQTMDELMQSDDPLIQDYFHGPRGRAAREAVCNSK